MRARINDSCSDTLLRIHQGQAVAGLDTFLRIRQVQAVTGLSRGSIYRGMDEGDFPKSIKLSSMAVGWSLREVQAWMAERLAARDASPTKH